MDNVSNHLLDLKVLPQKVWIPPQTLSGLQCKLLYNDNIFSENVWTLDFFGSSPFSIFGIQKTPRKSWLRWLRRFDLPACLELQSSVSTLCQHCILRIIMKYFLFKAPIPILKDASWILLIDFTKNIFLKGNNSSQQMIVNYSDF